MTDLGQRIELGEIEYAASRTQRCRDVAAEVVAGILVLFCVLDDTAVTPDAILDTCRKWLPAFMIPGDVVILGSLPYLPSGKCDRKALRSDYEASPNSNETSDDTSSELSRTIANTIGSILDVEARPDSILPGLGLDSLSSIQIASALRKQGYPQLDASSILLARTPHDLATELERLRSSSESIHERPSDQNYRQALDSALKAPLSPGQLTQIESSFLCTPVQIAMLTETEKDPQAYCNWIELRLPKTLQGDSVEAAIQTLSQHHSMLRSGFVAVTGLEASYATVVWQHLSDEQITHSSQFDYRFEMNSDERLLRPCHFQIKKTEHSLRLLLHVHHALYDQWSMDILRSDLAGILEGQMPSPSGSFKAIADYYYANSEQVGSSETIEFWQDYLRDVSTTSLPLLRGNEVESRLQRTPWQDLSLQSSSVKSAAKSLGCSTPAIFQSVLGYLLSGLTGSLDVVLGSVFSGRNVPVAGIDGTFGPCLATLPFRLDFGATETVEELFQAVTDQNRALQRHVLTSPTAIRAAAGVAPGTALFDTLFVWQESTRDNNGTHNRIDVVESEDRLEFNLVVEFEPSPSSVKVRATYQERLLSSEFVQILLQQVDCLTSKLLESPKSPIMDLSSWLPPNLLSIQNPEPSQYATSYDLPTAIQDRAANNPSATAIMFASCLEADKPAMTSISYKELDERSNQMAHALLASGLKPRETVCICMEKCIDLYVAMLATFKAGAGYLPLVPETPVDRIKSVVAQANVNVSICDSSSISTFRSLQIGTIVDIESWNLTSQPKTKPEVNQVGSRVAYCVFTSGSTGEPKGVPITMDNLKGNLAVLHELYQPQTGDRLLQSCSQAFDVSVFEIFFAFYSGMCLCSAIKDVMFRDFEESIRTFKATHLSLTPTVAALVNPDNVPDVRFLVTAGEGITEKVHRTWAGRRLHQGYGPSETTNICSVKMNVAPDDVLGNIGPAFKNTSAFVLTAQGQFCVAPAGAYGEFAFGGEQVFHGYIGREDLNSEKIIHHPEFGRVYRSGDMGRILPDGTLLISGRVDDQVKIRGNRVELGEINAVVSDHSGVTDCTTVVLGEKSSEQTLATFWVPAEQQSAADTEIRVLGSDEGLVAQLFDRLESSLPAYMIPSILVPMSRLPMTSQGKLDKRLLRSKLSSLDGKSKEAFSRSQEAHGGDPPASESERTMAAILADILGLDVASISRNSSFFALGLNSLNAIQFAKVVKKQLGVSLGVTAILKHSSIARLSPHLDGSRNSSDDTSKPSVHDVFTRAFVDDTRSSFTKVGQTVTAILPCTPLQEAMLSASSTHKDAYCNTTNLHFEGDLEKLHTVWQEMTRRHAILRTTFVETPLAAYPHAQVVLEQPGVQWCVHASQPKANGAGKPLSNGHANGVSNGHANGHANGGVNGNVNGHDKTRPDIPSVTASSPVRVDVVGSDIYLQMHHAIYDGVAVANLFEEIKGAYEDEKLPPAVSFEPFLEHMIAQNSQEAIDFWAQRMNGFRPHPLPVQQQSLESEEQVLNKMIDIKSSDVDAFCERHACTTLSLVQAAWVKTLTCMQDIKDVCFGNVVSGRTVPVPDIDRLVAPCFNTIPVRLDIQSTRTNVDLCRTLHRYNVETLPFQLTAPRKVQALSREPSARLFDSLLLVQPPQDDFDFFDAEEEGMDMGIPIVLEVVPFATAFELQLHYMPEKVPASLVPELADAFCSALASCLRYPSSSMSHFLDFDITRIQAKLAPEQRSSDVDARESAEVGSVAEWNDEQKAVRAAMAELAGIDPSKIAQKTSIYQIGLDSLNAVQLASRLRQQGFEVDAADVMQYQTPLKLSKHLEQQQQSQASSSPGSPFDLDAFDDKHRGHIVKALSVDPDLLEAVRPCNSSQCGMLAQFIESQGSYYLNHRFYEVPDQYDFTQVQQAWKAVQRKHQVLRMGFYQLEDAALPYAMLIYRPDTVPDVTFPNVDGYSDDDVEDFVSKQVMQNMHLPAWRVSLTTTDGKKKICLSLHHALYDADSLQLLLHDFSRALHGQDLGSVTNIDPLLASQLQGFTSQKHANEKFWQGALENARLVRFPNLTPTIISETRARSSHRTSTIDIAVVEKYCKAEGVTLQSLGQSAWAMLLSAYLGEPSVTFGTVFSGLASDARQPVAFPAISTVPVYCDASKSSSQVVQDMVSYNAGAQKHRFAALSDIQRYAGSVGQALFDTLFVYQKATGQSPDSFDWLEVRGFLGVDYVASMEMETSEAGQLGLRLTYDIRSIPDEHADLMLQQYDLLLESFVNGTSDLQSKGLRLMSHTPPKEPSIPCTVELLHQFVERGARDHPHQPALEFITDLESGEKGRKIWTYKELDERSNQVAHLILNKGAKPRGIVSVCMTKSAEASFAFIGILKAGCAFLAMDPELPLARRKFIVEDSSSQLLFVDSGKPDAEMQGVVDTVELSEQSIAELSTSPVGIPPIDPSMTSYCLYTSGTTGTPKGCELTHENAVQAMMSFQRLFSGHWDESSRWLQFASYWFDVSVLEQFWSWSVGITLVGAPRDLVLEDLPGFIREANITHIDLTPSLARLLTPEEVPSLCNHVFITGGEALKQEIIDAWGPCKTICNGYGPTEATIGVTMNPFIGTDAKPSNIGPAFDNVGAYVFKPNTDELVLRGAVGELCVSGKLVGKGYLNRPELTAKAFPYLERYGERVYRTGDLVRLLADGSVSFIGRADTQAKLRGQRLEIDEIDAVIKSASESIFEVASLVTKSAQGDREMLVSFLVDQASMDKELRLVKTPQIQQLVQAADQACRNRLPGYMVPTHIIPVTRLPLTVNNKVDSKRLVSMFTDMTTKDLQDLKGAPTKSRDMKASERKVAKLLSKLLSIEEEDISPSSNIFSLGLSSVSAINFVTLLKRSGFKVANVAKVMNNPTLEQLVQAITSDDSQNDAEASAVKQAQLSMSAFAQRYRATAARSLSVDFSEIEAVAPCTPLQEGLLIESMKSTHRPYFNHFWYDVTGLDLQRLQSAVQRLCNSIPILRVAFFRTDDGYAQAINRQIGEMVEVCEAGDHELEDVLEKRRSQWVQGAEQDVLTPFEVVIAHSRGKSIMAMHVHHAMYDGISWDLTMDQLTALYKDLEAAQSGPNFIEALPYGPLCQRPDAKPFWQDSLKSTKFVPLQPVRQDAGSMDLSLRCSIHNIEALEEVRKRLGISHQALFQVAFAVAIHQLSPQTQTYGVVLSGRSISFDNADKIVGPMFNTVPFAMRLQPSKTWEQNLKVSQEVNAALLPFQHTPLRDIRKHCGRNPSDPMFDVLFVFQRSEAPTSEILFKGMNVNLPAEYPIAFEVELDDSGHAAVNVAAQPKFATQEMLQKLLKDFQKALACILSDAGQMVNEQFTIELTEASSTADSTQKETAPDTSGASDFSWSAEARQIQETISQIAGCTSEDVTEHSTIFSLGLDSIDAVKMASRLKKDGLSIPVSTMLKAQTIPKMLETLQPRNKAEASIAPSRLSDLEQQLQSIRRNLPQEIQSDVERVLPAAPGQEGLVADMLRSDFAEYYNSDVLKLHEDVDIEKLKAAWQEVVDASPILRTSFLQVSDPEIDATFAQLVFRPKPLDLETLSAQSLEELDQRVIAIREEVKTTFEQRPPLRLALTTIGSERYLILSLAHAQYDGHSLALMHQEVAKSYHGNVLEQRPPYDEAIDLALSATSEEAMSFWRDNLSGGKITHFPHAKDGTDSTTSRVEQTSEMSASHAIQACKRLGVSMQALAQATWSLVLAHYVQQLEVIHGAVLACRDSEEEEATMFPTMNTVPVRSTIHGTGHDMLRYAQDAMNEIRPHQRTPLRAIQNACASVIHGSGSGAGRGMFDTLFIFQNRGDQDQDAATPLYESVGGDSNVEYPVAVEMEAIGDDLVVRAACKGAVFNHEGATKLLQDFDSVLGHLLKTPEEQTVSFTNSGASICGLPEFQIRDERLSQPLPEDDASNQGNASTELSPLVSSITSALTKVAKVSDGDVTPDSTVESIGIDSISAIKVSAILRKESIKLPVSDLLRSQTPKKMAETVEAQTETPVTNGHSASNVISAALQHVDVAQVCDKAGVDKSNVEAVLPATAGQIYMLSMWSRSNGVLFYPTFRYHLKTKHSMEDLQNAWMSLVDRTPVLRTVFASSNSDDHPVLQLILKSAPESFAVDGKHSSSSMPDPMVALKVSKKEDGFQLALHIHHALYDAVSLPLLMGQLASTLEGSSASKASVQLEDAVAPSLTSQSRQARRNFWTQYLSDIKPVSLSGQDKGEKSKVQIYKPAFFTQASSLEQYARKAQVSVQALLFAIYAKVYSSHAGAGDVVFGIYLANRSHLSGLDELAAPTLNLLPLLVKSPKSTDIIKLAKQVDSDLRKIGTSENSASSLAEIYDWTGIKLDSFVNFLKLPDTSDESSESNAIAAIDDEWSSERIEVQDVVEPKDFALPQGLKNFKPSEAYQVSQIIHPEAGTLLTFNSQHALDVEISLVNDDLNIGVFCLENILDLQQAEALVAEVNEELEELVRL